MTLKKKYNRVRKTIIYELVCNITGERYIGSTISYLSQRLCLHRRATSECVSRFIINRNSYTFNILEEFYNRFELSTLLKEQYYMDNTININIKRALTLIRHVRIQYKLWINNNPDKYRNNLNKKNIVRKNEIPTLCACGGKYKENNKYNHFRTKKHIKYLNTLE